MIILPKKRNFIVRQRCQQQQQAKQVNNSSIYIENQSDVDQNYNNNDDPCCSIRSKDKNNQSDTNAVIHCHHGVNMENYITKEGQRVRVDMTMGKHRDTTIVPKKKMNNNTIKKKRKVHFSTVTINEHPIIVGGHPCVMKGPPLTIAWQKISSQTININEYERQRCYDDDNNYDDDNYTALVDGMSTDQRQERQRHHRRRTLKEMRLVSAQREYILEGLGYTIGEIRKGTKASARVRNQRKQTYSAAYPKLEENLEVICHWIINICTLGRKNRYEKQLLQRYS